MRPPFLGECLGLDHFGAARQGASARGGPGVLGEGEVAKRGQRACNLSVLTPLSVTGSRKHLSMHLRTLLIKSPLRP